MLDIPPCTRADAKDALLDAILLAAGEPVTDPHPAAFSLARVDLEDVARYIGNLPDSIAIGSRHLTQSDFNPALSLAVQEIIAADFSRAADEHSVLVRDVLSSGTRPVEGPRLDLAGPTEKGWSLHPLVAVETGDRVTPVLYSARYLLPRALDPEVIVAASRQIGGMYARLEAEAVANVLNAPTATMRDGQPLFIAGTNEATGGGLAVAAVAEAVGLLRTMPTPSGSKSNVAAKTLLVPPASTFTAHVLNESAGRPFRVVSNAWLDGSAAFLFADPAEAATLLRAKPRSYMRPNVRMVPPNEIDPATGELQTWDGIALAIEHVVGIGAVSRLGAVRIPLS